MKSFVFKPKDFEKLTDAFRENVPQLAAQLANEKIKILIEAMEHAEAYIKRHPCTESIFHEDFKILSRYRLAKKAAGLE